MPASFPLCRLLAALCGVWRWEGAPAHAALLTAPPRVMPRRGRSAGAPRQVTSLAQQIAALNKAVSDQRADAKAERDRQVSAFNATLVNMQIAWPR